MDKAKKLEELIKKRNKARIRLDRAKKSLDHPHGQWQSSHDLADGEFKVFSDYLDGIEKAIEELEKGR